MFHIPTCSNSLKNSNFHLVLEISWISSKNIHGRHNQISVNAQNNVIISSCNPDKKC